MERLRLPKKKKRNLGKKVTVGIRPEHVVLDDEAHCSFKGEVNVFELLGSNAIIYIDTNNGRIVMNTPHVQQHDHGEKIYLSVIEDKVHIFDPETERTITN